MNQILSQGEIDALLSAVSEGEVTDLSETEEIISKNGISSYDLTNHNHVNLQKLPQMDMIYEKFVRTLRTQISKILRQPVTVNHTNTHFFKFSEFLDSLQEKICTHVLQISGGGVSGTGLLMLENEMCFALVDSVLGGSSSFNERKKEHELTKIELALIRKISQTFIEDLESSWAFVTDMQFQMMRTESNVHFLGVIPLTDVVAASSFEIRFGNWSGQAYCVIPYMTLDPIKEQLSSSIATDQAGDKHAAWKGKIKEHIMEIPVNFIVNIGKVASDISHIMSLKKGDMLYLNNKGILEVSIGGVKKYKADYGKQNGNIAIQITDKM